MKTGFRLRIINWLVPLGFGIALWLVAPLSTTLQFGGDEGYELMKALLVSLGHPLYREVWNDQPPLHTELVALLFRLFGPSAYLARLLSVGFATVLVGALYEVVRARSGRVTGLVAVALLGASSVFIQLSVSVMLEIPAMALALAAMWAWIMYLGRGRTRWLVTSGVLFGCALQVKLTAAVFLPALLAGFWTAGFWRTEGIANGVRLCPLPIRWATTIWGASAAATFVLIAVAFYKPETFAVFWRAHFSAVTRESAIPTQYKFSVESLLGDLDLVVPAMAGLVWIAWRRRWYLLFPVILLGTVLAIHLVHRPYWYYYDLHFAIPLAWLGAVGLVEWFRVLWHQQIRASWRARLRTGIPVLGWSMVVSLVLTMWPHEVWRHVKEVQAAPTAYEDATVVALKRRAVRTHWIFTDQLTAAFWAGLPVPPDIAVIPSKRIWSGQIDAVEIRQCLERYRPELILLRPEWIKEFGLEDYLHEHYRLEPKYVVQGLYVRQPRITEPHQAIPRSPH